MEFLLGIVGLIIFICIIVWIRNTSINTQKTYELLKQQQKKEPEKELTGEEREILKLRKIEGDDVVCFAEKTSDSWLCVCGTKNKKELTNCSNCHRARDYVLNRLTREAILKI